MKPTPNNELQLKEEFLDKFTAIFEKENPNHTYTRAEVESFAWNVVNFVKLTYKPIPKDKQALYDSLAED